MMRLAELTPDWIVAMSDRLNLPVDAAEAESIAAEINHGLAGYGSLDGPVGRPAGQRLDPAPDADADHLNAYVSRFRLPGAEDGPLAGLEIAVKDNMAVAGVPLTCGSRVFEHVVPARDAAVVDRLLSAGAVIVGKTNMDELAYGPTSETSQFGPVDNPAAPGHVAGGSSSGSAATVANGGADAALGSDTGGSIRIPASFCGVVGFKPTWGVVPRVGFVELAATLDHIGPIAEDVTTAARVFDAIAGPDDRDPPTARALRLPDESATDLVTAAPAIEEWTFAVPEELFGSHVSDPVRRTVETRIDEIEAAGGTIVRVSIPALDRTVSAWNAITNTEFAATFMAGGLPVRRRVALDSQLRDAMAAAIRSDGVGFGPVVRKKAIEGLYLLTAYRGRHYARARGVCTELAASFADVLDEADAILSPTMPVTAPERGEWSPHTYSDTEEATPPLAVNTRPADLAGIPAITVPAGRADGRPVGIQFMAGEFDDATVLQAGAAFEAFGASTAT